MPPGAPPVNKKSAMSEFELKNIECSRQDNLLFHGVNFRLGSGELLQVNGANGSGKSSLLQICAGLIRAGAGQILWNGQPVHQCRYLFQKNISYVGHQNGLKAALTAGENLLLMQRLSGSGKNTDCGAILERLGLPGLEDIMSGRLSAGQKRRLALSRILMSAAELWLLDEPFNALDQAGKKIIEALIIAHCQNGGMAVFATHQNMAINGYPLQQIHLGRRDV